MTRLNLLEGNLGKGLQRVTAKPLAYGADLAGTVIWRAILASMVIMKYL